jgi:hypothetical protein
VGGYGFLFLPRKEVNKVGDMADMLVDQMWDERLAGLDDYDEGGYPYHENVTDKEWIKRCKEKAYGCTEFASNVRGVIFHYSKYGEISEKQRKLLIAYWLSDEAENCRIEFEEKWDIPF